MELMDKQKLFDLCKDNNASYVYADAFVEVCLHKDTKKPFINTVDWAILSLGLYDEDDLQDEFHNLEPSDYGITESGYYNVYALFSVHYDDNGVGHKWTFLEPEIVEMEFAISIEDMEANPNDKANYNLNWFDDLFGGTSNDKES
jgi:hypothetical protein